MLTVETYQSLCGDAYRESIATAFSFEHSGAWWNSATNGHALLAVREGGGELLRPNAPPAAGVIRKNAAATHRAPLRELFAWLNDCEKWRECEACKGTGLHSCDCHFCHIEAGDTCEECEGDKGFPARLQIDFGDISFDRVLAAKYLAPVADTADEVDVVIGGESDPIEFRGPGWFVSVMPMRRAADNGESTGELPPALMRAL